MLILKNVTLAFGTQPIFTDINLTISYDQKIGILGRNGAGKSTMLKAIAGSQQLDKGQITFDKKKTIAYLPQESTINSQRIVLDEACAFYEPFFIKQQKLKEIEGVLEKGIDPEHAKTMIDEYHQLQQELSSFDKDAIKNKAVEVLKGLGFSEERIAKPVSELSVGWQMRVCLARLLLQKADFYLFDEPTNHLDLPAKEWLLSFLNEGDFGYLLVTHDRYYLEHACDTILELERGKGTFFHGAFSYYLREKEEQTTRLKEAYIQQQKDITQKKKTIERFKASASKAKMAQSMVKQLDKMEIIEIAPELPKMSFTFPEVERAGKIVLEFEKIKKSFNDKVLFDHISGMVKREQKVALIAANGVGKTTLFDILVGNLKADSGTITLGHNVKLAYFQQEQSRVLKPTNTVIQEVENACTNVSQERMRKFLGSFLFSKDEVHKKIKDLSGGEKNRVAMVKLLLQDANFLILDEPTNHLDIYAKDILLQALKQFKGTILLVSHDHDFIQEFADTIMELTPHELISFEGNYEEYIYYRKHTYRPAGSTNDQQTHQATDTKEDAGSAKAKQIREFEKTISKLEKEIERLGLTLSELDYGTPEYDKLLEQLEQKQTQLTKTSHDWEKLQG